MKAKLVIVYNDDDPETIGEVDLDFVPNAGMKLQVPNRSKALEVKDASFNTESQRLTVNLKGGDRYSHIPAYMSLDGCSG